MTRLFNDPLNFAEEAISGLTAAYSTRLSRVPGGVVRSSGTPSGEVALVIGGGSGHYPGFAGWVGQGLAHAAACGNVFASPSASQIYSVCRAAERGGGILLSFGNYAGDVLHFGQAADRLRAEGVDVRVIAVSDDVASNTPDRAGDRRGVAGDLFVFKVAAAAAERGDSLDVVEAIARRANERTRSLGVAFDGCTLPGAEDPLFRVPEGLMSVGLGVHGEPGVREVVRTSAREVADLLVDGVLAEEPSRGHGYDGRVGLLLNGLGTVKYEELLVVFGRVAERLEAVGISPVLPEVGEIMTSLDMAGLSLSLCFLDPELEALWAAPVDSAAFRRGLVVERPPEQERRISTIAAEPVHLGSPVSRQLAAHAARLLDVMQVAAVDSEKEWGRIDAIAGDGDHGQGMRLGATGASDAAREALASGCGIKTLLVRAGEAWAESAGGTSGALWGAALTAVGSNLSDHGGADGAAVVRAVAAGCDAVVQLGGAELGDKTMVDAAVPFKEVLESQFQASGGLGDAWLAASRKASAAARATADIVARRGRARVLGEKSLGTPDPGAVSFAFLMSVLADEIATGLTKGRTP